MIKLKKVFISNFGAIGSNQEYNFNDDGIYTIIGKNLDAGGGNAASKTTFVQAIIAAIAGLSAVGITSKDAKNRYNNDLPCIVGVELLVNNDKLIIKRIIGGKLEVSFKDQIIEGKIDEIQKKIYKILGINEQQFLHLAYKKQESWGGFLRLKDSDKKEFLASFFDITELETAKEKNDRIIKILELQKNNIDNEISILSNKIDLLNNQYHIIDNKVKESLIKNQIESDNLSKKNMEINIEIEELQSIINNNDNFVKSIQSTEKFTNLTNQYQILHNKNKELIVKKDELDSQLLPKKQNIDEQLKLISIHLDKTINEKNQILLKIKELQKKQINNNQYRTEIVNIDKNIDNLKFKKTKTIKSVCHECGQPVNDNTTAELLEKIEKELGDLNNRKNNVQDLIIEDNQIDNELLDLESLQSAVEKKILEYKHSSNESELLLQKKSIEDEIKAIGNEIISIDNQLKNLSNVIKTFINNEKQRISDKIESLLSNLNSNEKVINSNKSELEFLKEQLLGISTNADKFSKELKEKDKELSKIKEDLNIAQITDTILSKNGFIGYIFDSILDELTDESNKNLSSIPVVSKYSISFSSDKAAKTTGNVTKNITYTISDSGSETSFQTLSGAEKTFLIVAVDEALDSILKKRLGISVDFKILDEQFMYSDASNKEPIIDFLTKNNPNKIYLLIDHSVEVNSSVGNLITLTKSNNISVIS